MDPPNRPGALVELASYLHDRSNGMIGSLLRLIRLAAIGAVLDTQRPDTMSPFMAVPRRDQPGNHV